MKPESRRWFDCAYNFLRKDFAIGFLTGPALDEDIARAARHDYTPEEFEKLKEMFGHYHKKLPPAEDFAEEKERIFKTLTPELKSCLGFVETAIAFGKVRGDIDIALISQEPIPDDQLIQTVKSNGLTRKYPLVDWSSLYTFRLRNGADLGKGLLGLAAIMGDGEIPRNRYDHIGEVINDAKLLWGDEGELERAKEYFATRDISSGKLHL